MAYELEGRLLEVCTCKVICPCWVGEDPDGGTCEGDSVEFEVIEDTKGLKAVNVVKV